MLKVLVGQIGIGAVLTVAAALGFVWRRRGVFGAAWQPDLRNSKCLPGAAACSTTPGPRGALPWFRRHTLVNLESWG